MPNFKISQLEKVTNMDPDSFVLVVQNGKNYRMSIKEAINAYVDLSPYYTKEETDEALNNVDTRIDTLEGLATFRIIPVSYLDLRRLRDNGDLVPGQQYRITDYITTTQSNTRSEVHPFDVIVLALSESELSEQAWAVQSARDKDGYFANSKLSAWKIWYCLDNDTNRFAWAMPETLMGTIKPITGSASGTYTYSSPISKIVFINKAYNPKIGVRTRIFQYDSVYITKTDDYTLVVEDKNGYVITTDGIFVYTFSQEGKGIIYRMIDEWNNDVPYDFYSILPEGKPLFPYPFTGSSHNNIIKPDINEDGQMVLPGVSFEKDVSNIVVSKNSEGEFVAYNSADLFSPELSDNPSPDNPSPYGTVYYIGEI